MDLYVKDKSNVDECEKCETKMSYVGLGEYKCEECGNLQYNDYGAIRKYVEEHPGVTAAAASEATGIPIKVIRELLREERIEIAPSSKVFMKCGYCGINIASGRFCDRCAKDASRIAALDEHERKLTEKKKVMAGFAMGTEGESGERRFKRE